MTIHASKIALAFLLNFFVMGLLSAQSFVGCPNGKERVPSSNEEYEQEVLRLVNEIRKEYKLSALQWDESLTWSARYHAKDMIVDNYFEHDLHDRKNRRLRKVCDTFDTMDFFLGGKLFARAENIGAGSQTPQEMVKDWMDSPGHKENILDSQSKYMGIGYLYDKDSEWGSYWVQCFGL